MKSTVKILGVDLHAGSINDALKVFKRENEYGSKCVSATGAHGLVFSKGNSKFKEVLDSFSLNLPDGMPGVWVGRMKGAKSMKRCYGPDFFETVMRASAESNITHFLCGGKEGVADKLKVVCENKFGAEVLGMYCPPFLDVEDYNYQEIATQINESKVDIVWIGLSTPKQERFASYLSQYIKVKYIVCVGAAFDFHIGNVRQAPSWIQKIGMEWFFRLLAEPKRLWKRYVEIVPMFIYYNFAELLTGNFNKK